MIPATFDYIRAGSVDEAIAALTEYGDEAKLLAGGHSLLPLMKLRLAVPEVVVDVGRIDALRGVRDLGDGRLSIGSMTPHRDVMEDELVLRHCGALADVTAKVGDPQVRHRGTIGGALAHADAASDLPAALLALDGSLVVQGPSGQREIAAADVFVDYLTTSIADDEVITEVRVPKLDGTWGWDYQKFSRVAQGWAIVGSFALVKRSDGDVEAARVGLTHMATVPLRAAAVEAALTGTSVAGIADAAARAAEDTRAPDDLNATREFREHLAVVLTRRALQAAAGDVR